ncbi:helix-turn-helix domain-containing protein [Microbacterium aurantiacum]|uniref:helix-turn-helix domain-containing protein n=1 Tax=Microbacterium aurantiacum TaxID=162393 RepID=UPI0040382068
MPKSELLSTVAVAAELNIHRSTLSRMVKAGKIKTAVKGEGKRGEMFFYPSEVKRVKERMSAERAA